MFNKTISIAIATFNSEKTLKMVLTAIKNQSYPSKLINVFLIDGGSTDSTKEIGKEFGCKILKNIHTEPVSAKFLAYTQVKSDYLVFLDHDEVLQSKDSLKNKILLMNKDESVKAVCPSGYKNPKNYPFINDYINEFGDPFSFFIYRLSKSSKFFLKTMLSRYLNHRDFKIGCSFKFNPNKTLPIIELCACGTMIDLKYFRKNFPETLSDKMQIPHLFYYMIGDRKSFAITKNDSILHYSSDTLKKYLNKIKWRIKNNIFHLEGLGSSGFSGRNNFQKSGFDKLKKYLFILYCLLLIPCLIDSIYLIISRKNIKYLWHVFLSLYTFFSIIYFFGLKMFGYRDVLKSYDNKKEVK